MGRANRRRDTEPELRLGSALHRQGYRYRRDFPVVAGGVRVRPDFVFTRARVAVFVDGCYWHGCPQHGLMPKANAEYWRGKLERNRQRDLLVNAALQDAGWTVLRFWEHEDPDEAAERVAEAISASRQAAAG